MTRHSDPPGGPQTRTYARADSVVFLKTKEAFGGLSNMASGFPLEVNRLAILTTEALYQACRFPHMPDVQRLIIGQASPMTAKMKSKPYRRDSRPDWDQVRVKIMRWCLRVKLAQNWRTFGDLLLATGDRPIVEEAPKDDFWGAKPIGEKTLVGMNVLGRLLMELREEIRSGDRGSLRRVGPLAIPDFWLNGQPIETVVAGGAREDEEATPEPKRVPASRKTGAAGVQASLFDQPWPTIRAEPLAADANQPAEQMGRLKPYPAMKDSSLSWLGAIPSHWQVRRAKNVFRCVDIRSETGQEELLTVSSERGVVPRRTASVTMFKAESYVGHKLCWPGDLVINSLWAWARGLGVSRYHGIISTAYGVYRPRPDAGVEARFVDYMVRSAPFHWELRVRSKGVWTSRLQLTDESFLGSPIPLPPLPEQAAIVRFLDHADRRIRRYIRAKQKLIKLLEEQKQAIIHRAVTRGLDPNVRLKPSGMEWLGDIPEHWEVSKLKFEMSFCGGGTPSKAEPSYWNGDIPWVSPKDMKSEVIRDTEDHITNQAVAESSTKLVPAGSILIVVRSGILQRTIPIASCDREVALNQDMKALSLKGKITSGYFILLVRGCENSLLTEWTKQGATVESIEHQFLANTQFPIPPADEQAAIVRFIAEATKEIVSTIDRARREISLLREYRTRLISDVVTGKLDVREAAAQLPDEAEEPEPLDETETGTQGDEESADSPDAEEAEA